MKINYNQLGMYIGATIAVVASVGSAIVTAKVACVALTVLAFIGLVLYAVSRINEDRVKSDNQVELDREKMLKNQKNAQEHINRNMYNYMERAQKLYDN